MLAVIGGSGFYSLGRGVERIDMLTHWGAARVHRAELLGNELLFIPRHGETHEYPPHRVNYRANLRALQKLGASAVLATYACGVIARYRPGDIVLLDDFIGFNAPITCFDSFAGGMKHIDMSAPYDRGLRDAVLEVASANRIRVREGAVMAGTRGPRFETRAEVRALKAMGAHLVNMTAAYEAAVANELELPLAGIAVCTNWACGISKKPLSVEEVVGHMAGAQGKLTAIIAGLLEHGQIR